jgi:hypothetical protein
MSLWRRAGGDARGDAYRTHTVTDPLRHKVPRMRRP